jgi:ketosteroid isomerase-like protein
MAASEEEVDLARAEVLAANDEFYAAVEAGDLERLAAVWAVGDLARDATCVHPGWPSVVGREAVLRSWALILANSPYLQFFLTDVTVRVIGEVAVVTCTENILTGVGDDTPDGAGELTGGRATTVNVFQATPRGWVLWLHHSSPVLGHIENDEEG